MPRYWYDTEFLEDGASIALISIGIVCEDGREYYAVNSKMPIRRIRKHPWLMANVVPGLPRAHGDRRITMPRRWLYDYASPHSKHPKRIAREVEDFLLDVEHRDRTGMLPHVELWAWYGAYDHVALAWLFGPMSDMPEGIPYWTNDLRQEAERLGVSERDMPQQADGVHNALADARHNAVCAQFLAEVATQRGEVA
jgi:hypothetical protein